MTQDTCCFGSAIGEKKPQLPELCSIQHAIFEHAGRGIVLTDASGLIVYFNRAAQRMLGYTWDEVAYLATPLIFHVEAEIIERAARRRTHPIAAFPSDQDLLAVVAEAGQVEDDWTLVRKDGSRFPASLSVSILRDDDGAVQGYLGIVADLSERKQQEQDLRIAAIAFESQAAIMVTDAEQRILKVNGAFSKLTGYSAEEAIGQKPCMLKSGRQDAAFYIAMWNALSQTGHWQGEIWNRRKNGEIYPEWLTISGVYDGQGRVTHYVSTFSDLSSLKVAESEIHNLAFYDPLTALPNRRLFLNRLDKACASGKRTSQFGALIIIDIDHFKTLNDTLGHDVGDRLLVEVSERLRFCVRESDTAARLGGDEFVVMLEDLGADEEQAAIQAGAIAEKIRAELGNPYLLNDDNEYFRTASLGISLFRGHDKSLEVLLKQADIALYKAKDAGRNALRFFDNAMQTALDERARLETGLRRAIDRKELRLYVQPQVDQTRRLIGAETLLRWQPKGMPMIAPGDFIPLAEETGLIVPIGLWVLDEACALLARWSGNPLTSELALSVNISARQFRQPDFVDQVCAALQRHSASPRLLKLELTESCLLDSVDDVVSTMRRLLAMGIRFSLDDFGTGYASLAYLKRFPFEQLKVDRSFVSDIMSNPDDAAIVRAIVAMGNALRLNVLAEGVEQDDQQDYLVRHGCYLFQGFLFGKPVPPDEFERILETPSPGSPGAGDVVTWP